MFNLRFLITVMLITSQSLTLASGGENNIQKPITSSPKNQALAVTHLPFDLQKIVFDYLSEYTPTALVKADQNFSIIDSSLSPCGRYLTTVAANFNSLEMKLEEQMPRFFEELQNFAEALDINDINDIVARILIIKEAPEVQEYLKKLIFEIGDFVLQELPQDISIKVTQLDTNKVVDYPVAEMLGNCKGAIFDLCEEFLNQLKTIKAIDDLQNSQVLQIKLIKIKFAFQAFLNLLSEIFLEKAPSLLGAEILNLKNVNNPNSKFFEFRNRKHYEESKVFTLNHFKADKAALSKLIEKIKCFVVLEAKACGQAILDDECVDSARAISPNNKYIAWAQSNRTVENLNDVLSSREGGPAGFLSWVQLFSSKQQLLFLDEILKDTKRKSTELTNKFILKIYNALLDKIEKEMVFEKQVDHVAIAPNNKYFAVISDQSLLVYDLSRDKVIWKNNLTESEAVTYLKFGFTDAILNMHMKDGQVKLLDLNTAKITELIDGKSIVKNIVAGALIDKHNTVSFSQNGHYMACEQNAHSVQVFTNQSYELQRSEDALKKLADESDKEFNGTEDSVDLIDMAKDMRSYVLNLAKYVRNSGFQQN